MNIWTHVKLAPRQQTHSGYTRAHRHTDTTASDERACIERKSTWTSAFPPSASSTPSSRRTRCGTPARCSSGSLTLPTALRPFDVSFHDVANGHAVRTSHEPGRVACSVHRQRAFRGGVRLSFFSRIELNVTHGGPGACCELCVHRPECEAWTWRLGANDGEGTSCALLRDGRGDDKLRLWTREEDAVSGVVALNTPFAHGSTAVRGQGRYAHARAGAGCDARTSRVVLGLLALDDSTRMK